MQTTDSPPQFSHITVEAKEVPHVIVNWVKEETSKKKEGKESLERGREREVCRLVCVSGDNKFSS